MTRKLPLLLAVTAVCAALLPAGSASASKSIRVGIADQSPRMFDNPLYQALNLKRTRYFVASDVMSDPVERAKAVAFISRARGEGVKTLLHISTTDLRSKRGPTVSTRRYRSDAKRIVRYFRKLGVKEFGAWNEVNHKTQETWNKIGNAVSYYKSMYSAVKSRCKSCTVVGLDVLDQAGSDRYIRSFYKRLSSRWRQRLGVVGIHNYSDVNRKRTRGLAKIIRTVRRYNRRTKFWLTETGALASFKGSFPYSLSRQSSRIKFMFSSARKYRRSGVNRIYSYNWHGVVPNASCGRSCLFDAGLVNPDGSARPVYASFRSQLRRFGR